MMISRYAADHGRRHCDPNETIQRAYQRWLEARPHGLLVIPVKQLSVQVRNAAKSEQLTS